MIQIKSKLKTKNLCLILLAFVFTFSIFNAREARAATTVYFDPESPITYEGDTFIVNFKISTPDKEINVVDGTILYDNGHLEIKEVGTGASILSLWPAPPAFSNDGGWLSFVGGALGGFKGEGGEILKIIFLAKNSGEAKIDFLEGFSVFLNDGRGTQIDPSLIPFALEISTRPPGTSAKNEWQDLLLKDKTPPEFVEAIIGKDPSIFDNKYFVSFFATDDGTGIAYYEIREGSGDFVRTESPHLIQDQSLESVIQIKAVDKSGNEIIATPTAPLLAPEIPYGKYFVWILGILAALILILVLRRVFKTMSK